MGKLKEEMIKIHKNTDFVIKSAGVTQLGEFRYTHGGSVQPGLEYHIHYTNDKEEVFMTGGSHNSSSKIIEKVNGSQSLFSTYSELKSQVKEKYPVKYTPFPSKSDYRIGTFKRYFAQKLNNVNGDLFEISEEDNGVNNLFRYITIDWILSGRKSEVIYKNQVTINNISRIRGNERFRRILFPLQFWRPSKNSIDDIQGKLSRRKITADTSLPPLPQQKSSFSYNTPARRVVRDFDISRFDRTPIVNPATGETIKFGDLKNIVYDGDGVPKIGFADGTRVDLDDA